jgi:hypothetical protein
VTFRLVDADGIAFEPEPRTGRYGVDLAGWAEIEGVPAHVWWNLRQSWPENDETGYFPRIRSSASLIT